MTATVRPYPALASTALLGGLLAATYVHESRPELRADEKPARRGGLGGLLSLRARPRNANACPIPQRA